MEAERYTFCVVVDTRATYIKVKRENLILNSWTATPSGVELTLALIEYLKAKHHLLIGRFFAEKLILEMGSAYIDGEILSREIGGRDLGNESPTPKKILITTHDIQIAIIGTIDMIINNVKLNLKHVVPTQLHPLLNERGISLEGDFAYLDRLDQRFQEELVVKVTIYSDFSE